MEHVSLDSQPHSFTKAELTFDETCPNNDEESMCIRKEVGCAEIYALNVLGQIFDEVIKILKQEVVMF